MGRSIHQRKECLMKNMEFVGFDDLNGKPGFQMAMQKANGHYYLYATSFRWNGINILDVTDPTNLKKLNGWKDSGLMTVSMTDCRWYYGSGTWWDYGCSTWNTERKYLTVLGWNFYLGCKNRSRKSEIIIKIPLWRWTGCTPFLL